jgi:3-deoxy-manno-octulosonate cytidylyltransferase (CMP-KDO synthetase)
MGSTRFPGKPLAEIAGVSMLRRTARIAAQTEVADYVVATDHADIASHCDAHNIPVVMTDVELASGSDRTLAAAKVLGSQADNLINLQGDAPFTDPAHLRAVIDRLNTSDADIATPYVQLSWEALDDLRASKMTEPFSGTTLIVDPDENAVWFSKTIIPAIRKEDVLRQSSPLSPVRRHIGLYAYRRAALERYVTLPVSHYEALEGLEQLRALEAGLRIAAVAVAPPQIATPGIDTLADLARAESLIAVHGDPFFA